MPGQFAPTVLTVPDTETGDGIYVGGGYHAITELPDGTRALVLPHGTVIDPLLRLGYVNYVPTPATPASPSAPADAG